MSLGGKLFFNKSGESKFLSSSKTSVRGHGNQHDEDNSVDLKIGQDFIKNGTNNYFPFEIETAVKKSMLQKRAFRTITNLINGKIVFQNRDGSAVTPARQQELQLIYKNLGITKHDFTGPTIRSNYLQGGAFVANQWESNGREFVLSSVTHRQYKTGRLSFPLWNKGKYVYPLHYFHRNWGYSYNKRSKKVSPNKKTKSWIDWNRDPKKNFDDVCYIPEFNQELNLNRPVNRLQSTLIGDFDGLSDHYPQPCWFTGTTYNYERAEFLLSCFDIDDLENGFHADGIVKVYHTSYVDPESALAKQTFAEQSKLVEEKLRSSYNSGAVMVVPVGLDSSGEMIPTSDFMEFEPFKTNENKDRHEIFDKRISNKILGANGIIMPELVGVRDEKSTLSESGDKLLTGVKLLLQFTIKPQKALLDDPVSGYFNERVNDVLGIEERTVIAPNMAAFLNMSENLMKHFLHPDQWFDMFADFGLSKPTIEQIASQLIPAYITKGTSMNKITIE